MVKEILNNIIEFLRHIWEQASTSINDDLENGGVMQVAKNKYAISLILLLLVSLSVSFMGSSSVEVKMAGNAKDVDLPEDTIKQAIYLSVFTKIDSSGDLSIDGMKVSNIEKKQMDGLDTNIVTYEMEIAGKGQPKKQVTGNVTLAKQGGKWAVLMEGSKQWTPVS